MSGTTTTWSLGANGSWNTPANWTNGIPNSSVAATIQGGIYTVTINGISAAGSLAIASGPTVSVGLGDTLTVSGPLSVTNGAALENLLGTVTITGDLSALAGTTTVHNTIFNIGGTLSATGALTLMGNSDFYTDANTTIGGTGTLSANSTLNVTGGAFTLGSDLSSGGTVDITGGTATFDTSVTGAFDVGSGGTAVILGNVLGPATFTLAGSNVELGNGFALTTLDFGTAGSDNLFLDNAATTLVNTFNGFAVGDKLAFRGVSTISSVTLAGDTLTVSTSSGTYTLADFTNSAGSTFTTGTETFNGNSYGYVELVCFVTGTRIRTERGEVAVEDIGAGDRVVTLEDGAEVLRPVTWVGHRRLDVAAHPRPELAAPVRIRTGAFGEGLPGRDLLVSPDHCLFVDGKLVPAKLLVNGMTIVNERSISTVTYHHIELDRHSVILAEGLAAESYLDTSNRGFFSDAGRATVLHPEFAVNAGHPAWAEACAPLASDPAELESLWHRVAARAEALGHVPPVVQTTKDADLQLVADGKTIRPVAVEAGRHVFVLPPGAHSVRLASRFAVPADLAPYTDDRRRLGVAVARITVRSATGHREIPADHPMLSRGWHAAERAGATVWRWTEGDAALPLDPTAASLMLEVQLEERCATTYILRDADHPRRLAA